MTSKLKIGIVEDDMIIADYITDILVSVGYAVPQPAARYSEAIDLIEKENPDLLLVDINLVGKLDGINLAETVRKEFRIPFIFLTANTDAGTLERAKDARPAAYLAKPITKEQLHAAIEIAFSNYNKEATGESLSNQPAEKDHVFVKDGYSFRKIYLKEVVFLESEQNYVAIHTADKKKTLLRTTLGEVQEQFGKQFKQIHRSYVVNTSLIEALHPTEVSVNGIKLPLGKSYRDELVAFLRIGE